MRSVTGSILFWIPSGPIFLCVQYHIFLCFAPFFWIKTHFTNWERPVYCFQSFSQIHSKLKFCGIFRLFSLWFEMFLKKLMYHFPNWSKVFNITFQFCLIRSTLGVSTWSLIAKIIPTSSVWEFVFLGKIKRAKVHVFGTEWYRTKFRYNYRNFRTFALRILFLLRLKHRPIRSVKSSKLSKFFHTEAEN